jgi:spermidine/putrescine-binding protein
VDQVRDKMIGGEAAIGVIYSGEVLYCQEQNADLAYVLPEEGSNVWLDCWVIPKNAQNKENAEAFINFLCDPEIAVMNFEYITYATPNAAAKELLAEDYQGNPAVFPDETILSRCETFQYLGEDAEELYSRLWKEVRSN